MQSRGVTHCFVLKAKFQFNSDGAMHHIFISLSSDGICDLFIAGSRNIAQWDNKSAKKVIRINFIIIPNFDQQISKQQNFSFSPICAKRKKE